MSSDLNEQRWEWTDELDAVVEWSELLGRYLLVSRDLTMTLNWNHLAPVERADVKIRYRSTPVSGTIGRVPGGFTAQLDEPVYGAAPGQTAVVYDCDVVVGAGTLIPA